MPSALWYFLKPALTLSILQGAEYVYFPGAQAQPKELSLCPKSLFPQDLSVLHSSIPWASLSVSHPSSLQMGLGVTGLWSESAGAHDHTR